MCYAHVLAYVTRLVFVLGKKSFGTYTHYILPLVHVMWGGLFIQMYKLT